MKFDPTTKKAPRGFTHSSMLDKFTRLNLKNFITMESLRMRKMILKLKV
jgi:hypothetical protein